ncbi:hypothetical protein C8F01DRAFT_997993 [Mycena amicta]|nr:hypothetical protein C8F01DRAFT_997993 [Mycena amicta]
MAARYSQLAQDDSELDDAFGGEEIEPTAEPFHPAVTTAVPGAYDFEREYFPPPPGSPPRPSASALPNSYGNSNGTTPGPVVLPRPSFFRRAVGALLPTHYTRLPASDPGRRGGGNDGVWANVMAKPQPARTITAEDGQIIMVPEDTQNAPPPSYAAAQLDAVPQYWETNTVHAPAGLDSEIIIDDLPSGTFVVFLFNMAVSFFFQFVGFLLTFLLHTSHAAKYGSRAGLGLTLIQYGFSSRSGAVNSNTGTGGESDEVPEWPGLSPNAEPTESEARPDVDVDFAMGGISSRDWLSFLLMTLGWFLLLSSFIGFWRIKRWERGIRTTNTTPLTPEDIERDAAVRRNIENVFGFSFNEEDEAREQRRRPVEARLARDLRAAGLL